MRAESGGASAAGGERAAARRSARSGGGRRRGQGGGGSAPRAAVATAVGESQRGAGERAAAPHTAGASAGATTGSAGSAGGAGPSHCPHCAGVLRRGRVVGRRQVIELPPARRRSGRARGAGTALSGAAAPGAGGRCRTGARRWGPIAGSPGGWRRWWRCCAPNCGCRSRSCRGCWPHVWGRRLSVGAWCGLLAEAARAVRPAYEGLLAEARASPVLHLDETGWREDGRNGWVWTLSTPTVRLFHFTLSRAGAVAERCWARTARGGDRQRLLPGLRPTATAGTSAAGPTCCARSTP